GAGAVAGGILGALVDVGVPEAEARLYEEGIRRGGTLLLIRTDSNMAERAASIMNQAGAVDIQRRRAEWKSSARQPVGANEMGRSQWQPGQQRTAPKEGEIRVPVAGEGMARKDVDVQTMGGHRGDNFDSDYRNNFKSTYA